MSRSSVAGARTWAGQPHPRSLYDITQGQWARSPQWPALNVLTLYARVDGGFSVWDPIRNAISQGNGHVDTLPNYHLTHEAIWEGLRQRGKDLCNGLLRDWVDWHDRRTGLFDLWKEALRSLSLPDEPLRPGKPARTSHHRLLDIPTLELPYGIVPVIYAPAAVRRILELAYMIVWSWHEHREAARVAGQPIAEQVVLLLDEVELHLPPKWQRVFLPSLFQVIQQVTGRVPTQVVASTHSQSVTASVEHLFDRERDKAFCFSLDQERILVNEQALLTGTPTSGLP